MGIIKKNMKTTIIAYTARDGYALADVLAGTGSTTAKA